MALPCRPLGAVKQMLEQIGLEVTYAYDDLVFLMHNPALLQFGEVGEVLYFHVNVETGNDEAQQLFAAVQKAAAGQGISLLPRGKYRLSAGEDENLSLEFLDDAALQ